MITLEDAETMRENVLNRSRDIHDTYIAVKKKSEYKTINAFHASLEARYCFFNSNLYLI